MLNIWTYNINSIRKKVDIINALLLKHDIDILFITETKIKPVHEKEIKILTGYKVIWNSNLNSYYHGVAFFYKQNISLELLNNYLPNIHKIKIVRMDLKNNKKISSIHIEDIEKDTLKAHNTEGRILSVKCAFNNNIFIIVGTYVPNSGCDRENPLKRLAYRTLRWDKDLYYYLLQLEKEYSKVIWLGDLNVACHDCDIYNPKINIAGTTPEERFNFNNFLKSHNWIDTWHIKNLEKKSIRERCTYGESSHCKLRIDYVVCSSPMNENIVSSSIDHNFEGSDHIPMGTKFLFN